MRKTILNLLIVFVILLILNLLPVSAGSLLSPSQIISSINQYRTSNGLNSLSTNGTLSSLAQSQSEYQASIGSVTHTGPGGTTPKQRAYAAGYGGGNTIFMSEIIYGGGSATVSKALTWWKNSPLHNSVMLDSRYLEIGAGVATNGDSVYFTAELAWVSGFTQDDGGDDGNNDTDTNPEGIPAAPVFISTPHEDGKIIHEVLTGQSLWSIAAVYKVDLAILQDLNGLSQYDYIFPGDQIIIQPANTPLPSSTPSPTHTSAPPTLAPALGEAITEHIGVTNTTTPNITITSSIPETNPTNQPPRNDEEINIKFMLGTIFLIFSIAILFNLFTSTPKSIEKDFDDLNDL